MFYLRYHETFMVWASFCQIHHADFVNYKKTVLKCAYLRNQNYCSDGSLKDGTKESNLFISREQTLTGDQTFTCRVYVGDQKTVEDTLAYLKTFSVRSVSLETRESEMMQKSHLN